MKRLLLGSVSLIAFSAAILIFQASCKKDAIAQTTNPYTLPAATTSTLGGVIVDGTSIKVDASGKISTSATNGQALDVILYVKETTSAYEYWLAKTDGTNQRKINISLPAGVTQREDVRLTPDGQKLIFTATDGNLGVNAVYSAPASGGAASLLFNGAAGQRLYLKGLY